MSLDSFFHSQTHTSDVYDSHHQLVDHQHTDHLGQRWHSDALGRTTGHDYTDGLGRVHRLDAMGREIGTVDIDSLGHHHLRDTTGMEQARFHPNALGGGDLFLSNGTHLGSVHDLGQNHAQFQADPLVGMNTFRFTPFTG